MRFVGRQVKTQEVSEVLHSKRFIAEQNQIAEKNKYQIMRENFKEMNRNTQTGQKYYSMQNW